jgi:acetyl-CoA carboxylase biotin carboxyl carrier protein
MKPIRENVELLAGLMDEFGLDEARLAGEDWAVALSRLGRASPAADEEPGPSPVRQARPRAEPRASGPSGTPVTSPTTGIFYQSASPGQPAFVKVGDTVSAGQVIGLIEAMKVFNEITTNLSGRVLSIAAENGQLVNPGDPLIYVG